MFADKINLYPVPVIPQSIHHECETTPALLTLFFLTPLLYLLLHLPSAPPSQTHLPNLCATKEQSWLHHQHYQRLKNLGVQRHLATQASDMPTVSNCYFKLASISKMPILDEFRAIHAKPANSAL